MRLLTPSPSAKAPLYLVTTPTDRNAATSEGSTVWQFDMKPWSEQIDELVEAGQYLDALSLLDAIEQSVLPDKVNFHIHSLRFLTYDSQEKRVTRVRALQAVSEFRADKFDVAIDTFLDLDINPAKVVALYPEIVAGRLSVPQERWISLFGGPEPAPQQAPAATDSPPSPSSSKSSDAGKENLSKAPIATSEILENLVQSGTGTLRGRLRGFGALIGQAAKDDDTASIHSTRPGSVKASKKGPHGMITSVVDCGY